MRATPSATMTVSEARAFFASGVTAKAKLPGKKSAAVKVPKKPTYIVVPKRHLQRLGEIFLPYNTPSSKNNKQILKNFATGRPFIGNSEKVMEYKKVVSNYFIMHKKEFLAMAAGKQMPLRVGFYFVRDDYGAKTEKHFDYNNASQVIADLMQDAGWIDGDHAAVFVPVFEGYEVGSAENAGCYIKIL